MKTEEIKDIKLIFIGWGYSKKYGSYYKRFRVLINDTPIEDIFSEEELKNLAYWSNRSKVLAVRVWGLNQDCEAKLSVAGFLDLFHKEEYRNEWGKYVREVEKFIKII